MDIKTYPEMNETIKDLLRRSERQMNLYILARIEELERQVEDLTPPPNAPLTLEELREMDGEPVWVHCIQRPSLGCWGIRNGTLVDGYLDIFCDADHGDTWLAYRRKGVTPE